MIQYRNFLIIESKEEAKEKIFNELKDTDNYPQYYEFCDPYHGHYCEHWNKCTKNLIIERIKKDIDYLNILLRQIN